MSYNDFVIMIRFGDNDFGSTFKCVLLALRSWLEYTEEWDLYKDKARLVELINSLSPIAYKHCQDYNGQASTLEVTSDQILVGEEVDEWLCTKMSRANYAWFVLDMRIPVLDQQVYAV